MKYIAIAATSNKVIEDWGGTSEFSDEVLTQLAETCIGNPILMDFNENDQVGRIVSAKNEKGKLVIEFTMKESFILHSSDRVVPGFSVDSAKLTELENDQHHREIKKAISSAYGLTRTPAETNLPEIEVCKLDI